MSAKVLEEGDVSQSDVDKFSDSARELFETAYSYCVKWLSLGNLFYKGISLIEYFKSENISFHDLTELLSLFLRRFENYIHDPYQLHSLEGEYPTCQSASDTEGSEDIWQKYQKNIYTTA